MARRAVVPSSWGLQNCARGRAALSTLLSNTFSYQGILISQYSSYSRHHDQTKRSTREQLVLNGNSFIHGKTSKRVVWASFGTLLVTISSYFIYHSSERKGPIKATKAGEAPSVKNVGKVSVGGPFRLVSHQGRSVTDQDFTGKWTILYFGYTSCPDICPDELQKLAEAVDMIEMQTNEKVVPVFVTIDPERDSIAQIRAYLQEFHPRFVGLTGSVDDIRQIAREFRVFFKKIEDEGLDYLIDHSVTMYLMDTNMECVKSFERDYTSDDLADAIAQEIKKVK